MDPDKQKQPESLDAQIKQLCSDMHDIKLVLLGSKELNMTGIAQDVKELQNWRKSMDLRVAGIGSLAGAVIAGLAKWIFDK